MTSSWRLCLMPPESEFSLHRPTLHGFVPNHWPPCGKNNASLKNSLRIVSDYRLPIHYWNWQEDMCFSMSVANGVLADGNIKESGWKPETDEMTDVDVKARFQTGTTGNSSNQILEISDSDIARGVFLCFCLYPTRHLLFFYSVTSDGPNSECVHRIWGDI